MKSLKYSAMSKAKKQREQQKSHISVLNTLKQDDEICSNLLDTLSDDYIGYLEGLMGKKGSQNHITQKKINNHSHSREPSINDEIQKIKDEVSKNNVQTINKKLIPQKDQAKSTNSIDLESSIVKLEPQKKSIEKNLLNVKKTGPEKIENERISPKQDKKTKQKISKEIYSQKPQKRKQKNKRSQNISTDKNKIINNIQGYLKSLSVIKPEKQSFQNGQFIQQKRKSKSVSANTNYVGFINSKNQQIEARQNHENKRQQIKKEPINEFQKHSVRQVYITPFQKEDVTTDRNLQKYLSKKSQRQIIQNEKFLKHQPKDEEDSEGSSIEKQSIEIQPAQQQFTLKRNILNPPKKESQSGSHNYKNSKKKQNKAQLNLFQQRPNDSSLQQLLIKIITKYNKLLTKYNTQKQKAQHLETLCFELKQENQNKDVQIQTLKQLHKQLFQNPPQMSFGSKTQIIRPKKDASLLNHSNEQNYFQNTNEKQKIFHDDQENEESFELKNFNFHRKVKQHSGKTVNIKKMMDDQIQTKNINRKDKINDESDPTTGFNKSKNIFFYQKNSNRSKSIREKQKRSISCRQNLHRPYEEKQLKQNSDWKEKKLKERQQQEYYFSKTLQNQNAKKSYQFSGTLLKKLGETKKETKDRKIIYEGSQTYGNDRQSHQAKDINSEVGQYSARKKRYFDEQQNKLFENKWNTLDHNPIQLEAFSMNQQQKKASSESYNSLSFKRKSINDLKYKFLKDNYENQDGEPAKYHWKNKLNQSQKSSSSESETDNQIKKNLQYFANNIRGSISDNYFKKEPFFYNQESESTDSQLLQKLLSIKKNSNFFGGKHMGTKNFFK